MENRSFKMDALPKNIHPFLIVGLIGLFFWLRWDQLFLPYFWDEAWSYIPAVMAMMERGPCLLPNCIDPELYRGHPLLFYFLAASWGKIFGASLFSLHSFALVISGFTAFSFYRFCRHFQGSNWAIVALVLLLFQAVFMVQSAFVLPEILITLFTLELLLAYLKKQFWLFIFWGSLLVLTKESGLIILGAIYLFHLLNYFRNFRLLFRDALWLLAPLIPILCFYAYQKMILGWWLYPLHTSMIDLAPAHLFNKSKIIFYFLFFQQGRWIFWGILGALLFRKNLKANKPFALLCLCSMIAGLAGIYLAHKGSMPFLLLPIIIAIFQYIKSDQFNIPKVYWLYLILFLVYFLFSASNFLMLRYLLCILPALLFFFVGFWKKQNGSPFQNFSIVVILLLTFSLTNIQNRQQSWIDCATLNFSDMIHVHQEVVSFCESKGWQDKKIGTHFLMTFNLKNPDLGYLSGPGFSAVYEYPDPSAPMPDLAILSAIESHFYNFGPIKKDTTYVKLKRFESQKAWSEIYVKKSLLKNKE